MPTRAFYELSTAYYVARQCRFLQSEFDRETALRFMSDFLTKEEKMCRGSKARIVELMRKIKSESATKD